MTRAARRSAQVIVPLLLTMLSGLPAGLHAATTATATEPDDDSEALPDGSARAHPDYVDRLIGGLAPLPIDSDEGSGGPATGRPRSLTVESSATQLSPSSRRQIAGVGVDQPSTEAGVAVSGRFDTGNYGVLGLDGTLRYGNFAAGFGSSTASSVGVRNQPSVGGTLTLSDIGMPIGRGWVADSTAGVVDPRPILLAQAQSRFYLPSQPLLGAQIVLTDLPRDGHASSDQAFSVNLAVGEPGLPGGLRLAQFRGLGGFEATGGAEFRPAPSFAIGVEAIDAIHVRDPYGIVFSDPAAGRLDGQSVLVAASAGGTDWRVQANLQHSRTSRTGADPAGLPYQPFTGLGSANVGPGSATGAWVDGVVDHGRVSQSVGLFYLDPRLAWGATPMINDSYGGYYRINVADARWRWFAGIDVSRTVSGAGLDSEYFDAGARRQLAGLALGGEIALRVIGAGRNAASLNSDVATVGAKQVIGYVEIQSRLGLTRLEASYGFDREERLAHVSATQTWTLPSWLPSSTRLSTQVSYDNERDGDPSGGGAITARGDGIGVAVTAGGDLFSRISVDASIAYGGTSNGAGGVGAGSASLGVLGSFGGFGSNDDQHEQNFSATLAATARLSPRWTVTGSFTDSETYAQQAFGYDGLASAVPGLAAAPSITRDHFRLISAAIAVRYSFAAGRAPAATGNRTYTGTGTGAIAGHLFLDLNGNGRRDPGEAGVRDALVVLDGRAAVRTDGAGYYRFDNVCEGRHEIGVQGDALPLPWHYRKAEDHGQTALQDGFRAAVDVNIRATALMDIGAMQ